MNPMRWLRDAFLGPREPGPDDLVLLGRPEGEAEAELWKNILAQWGVPALVKNVSALAYIRLGDLYEVWVLQKDLEYALSLLNQEPSHTPTEQAPPDRTA
jgi:hypothetical protein